MTPELPHSLVITYNKGYQERNAELHLPSSKLAILIVDKGYLYIELDDIGTTLESNELCILTGIYSKSVHIENNTADLWIIAFDPSPIFQGKDLETGSTFLAFLNSVGYTKIPLKSTDQATLTQWLRLQVNKNSINDGGPERPNIRFWNLKSFLRELSEIYFLNIPKPGRGWHRDHILVSRFLQLIEIHFTLQHSVKWYADTLLVSSDHLSKVVKKITRKTAKQCIEERLIVAAKSMLLKNAPINRIWNILGFKTSSHFGYFFKKYTSMAPSAYRKQSFIKE